MGVDDAGAVGKGGKGGNSGLDDPWLPDLRLGEQSKYRLYLFIILMIKSFKMSIILYCHC